MNYNADLQELYRKFDGDGGDRRLAWYGQQRALGLTHAEAIANTFDRYEQWCREFWPIRDIPLPEGK